MGLGPDSTPGRFALLAWMLVASLSTVSAGAGPMFEFSNSVRSGITPDRYLKWVQELCGADPAMDCYDYCYFPPSTAIRFAAESVPNPVTSVEYRTDPGDGWTPAPCSEVPAVVGGCNIPWTTPYLVPCGSGRTETLSVRVTDLQGQSVERQVVIRFDCRNCYANTMFAAPKFESPADANQYFRDHEKAQNLPPPPPQDLGPRPNLHFSLLNAHAGGDSVFRYHLEQEQGWPVTALTAERFNLSKGKAKYLSFFVAFPATPVTVENRFRLRVWPENSPALVDSAELVAIAPAVTGVQDVEGIADLGPIPAIVSPNPFGATTSIRYILRAPGWVTLSVFDVRGHRVRTIRSWEAALGPRSTQWEGRSDDGRLVSSGVYYLQLSAGGHSRTQRVVLIR